LWPIIIALVVLNIIAVLLILPFLAGPPDGDQMPDMVRFIGRFHPVLLHLPIGILLLVSLIEFGRMIGIGKRGSGSTTVGVFFGAASAVVAAVVGFLLYHGGGWEESSLAWRHLWGGLAVAAMACASFGVKVWADAAAGRKAMSWILTAKFRLLLFATCGVMAFASHDGASLTHGENYLTQYAPDWALQMMGEEKRPAPAPVKPLEERLIFADVVAPILEAKCTQCHNADKQKGKLRMDTYELLLAGGKEGPAVELGSAAKSNIIVRTGLDLDDDEHMPPEGKPALEDHELAVLKWWLDSGAAPDTKVGAMEAPEEVLAMLGKLSPAVAAVPAGGDGGEKPAAPDAGDGERKQVEGRMADVPSPVAGGLNFESQESTALTFTAVSMRADFNDDAMGKLGAVLDDLVSIDLSATKITDIGASALAKASKLKMLRLSETSVSDASLEVIGSLPELESLNLYGTPVTDEGVKKLTGLKKLRKLYLWQTKVTEKGVEELKKALPECEVVMGV